MKQHIQQSIQAGVTFLASQQQPSGKFGGLSGSDKAINQAVATDTVFFTALIADCLQGIDQARMLRDRAADYLLAHKSQHWTWNYWERGSDARPYPDDLDDTACAVAALLGHRPELVNVPAQAGLATAVIQCEVAPGGPYTTWLTSDGREAWQDVDVAVNANIGYMFERLGLHSPPLESYITNCIANNQLESPYYVGIVPVLYFMARWYRGSQSAQLGVLVARQLQHKRLSVIERAMLIAAALQLSLDPGVARSHIDVLIKTQHDEGSWPAAALYVEPPQNGQVRFAGSSELTTAFVIEALGMWLKRSAPQPVIVARQQTKTVAQIVADAGGWQIKPEVMANLNMGSEAGWEAYTMYDDLLDGDAQAAVVCDANKAMRRSVAYFTKALSDKSFTDFVDATFDAMDDANHWELLHARDVHNAPDYGNYEKLAQRSWGHVIAPTGVLLAAGFKINSEEVRQFQLFFKHYIIARQLCDDAHDWQQDLRRGRVSAVVQMLLDDCKQDDTKAQQICFWEHTIIRVNEHIRHHLQLSRAALEQCGYLCKPAELYAWLTKLEAVCDRADAGRQDSLNFIAAYTSVDLVK